MNATLIGISNDIDECRNDLTSSGVNMENLDAVDSYLKKLNDWLVKAQGWRVTVNQEYDGNDPELVSLNDPELAALDDKLNRLEGDLSVEIDKMQRRSEELRSQPKENEY